MPNMGIGFASSVVFKKTNNFIMHIPDITHVGNSSNRVYNRVLLEERSARPSVSYKEIQVDHLIETVYFAGRPDWKPIKITLLDIAKNNPVLSWFKCNYDVQRTGINYFGGLAPNFKRNVQIFILDSCGYVLEAWNYMNAYPQDIDFGSTDMKNGEIMRVELTLRYDRAYWEACSPNLLAVASQYMPP
jgi:hypothetical protein